MRTALSGLLACAVLLAGCSGTGSNNDDPSPGVGPPRVVQDPELRDEALDLLADRARALRAGDRDAFLATVDQDDATFAAAQERWFDNLAQLPLGTVRLREGDADVLTQIAAEGDHQLAVELTLELEGYDERPVTQRLVYAFRKDGDSVVLANDRNLKNEAVTRYVPAPWDVAEIEVRRTKTVLGIFDQETVADADTVMSEVTAALADVSPHLPPWGGRIVVYDISDTEAMDRMSPMTVEDTGGVAFPVFVDSDSERTASWRFMVNPEATIDAQERQGLYRHELAHVGLGELNDHNPTWLVEGAPVAMEVAGLPPAQGRAYARALLTNAPRAPLATGRDFYQVNPRGHYATAGAVCLYLAETQGTESLWDLMRTIERERPVIGTGPDVDRIVRRVTGDGMKQLTAAARTWAYLS